MLTLFLYFFLFYVSGESCVTKGENNQLECSIIRVFEANEGVYLFYLIFGNYLAR